MGTWKEVKEAVEMAKSGYETEQGLNDIQKAEKNLGDVTDHERDLDGSVPANVNSWKIAA